MKELYILLVELANDNFQTKVNKLFEDGYQLRDSANFKYENGEVHIVQSFVLSERGIYREIEELVRSKVMYWEAAKEIYNERCKSVGHTSPFSVTASIFLFHGLVPEKQSDDETKQSDYDYPF